MALCDPGDKAALLKPYYFNHLMALQMTGVEAVMVPRDPGTFHPDMGFLETTLKDCKVALQARAAGAAVPPHVARRLSRPLTCVSHGGTALPTWHRCSSLSTLAIPRGPFSARTCSRCAAVVALLMFLRSGHHAIPLHRRPLFSPSAHPAVSHKHYQRIQKLCLANNCWLVLDNTYEYFVYGEEPHRCLWMRSRAHAVVFPSSPARRLSHTCASPST